MTYVLLVVIAWLAVGAGAGLVVSGLPTTMDQHDFTMARSEALLAGGDPDWVSRRQPANWPRISLGIQAILGGVLLGGFATAIRLLDDIAQRTGRVESARPATAPGPERQQATDDARPVPEIIRNLSGRPVRKW